MRDSFAGAYAADLAYVHDVGYDFHAIGLSRGLLKLLAGAGLSNRVVVDLGCGSGIWASSLAGAGYEPVGVDISPAMIELAQRRMPAGAFTVASFLDFELPPCGAITALGEVLAYQFDSKNGWPALAKLLRRAYTALAPGGLLVFDLAEIGLDRGRTPTCRLGNDWACFVAFEYDERREQLIRQITTFRQIGEQYRRHSEVHRIQLYDWREIVAMLRKTGFRVRTFRQLGDYALLPGRVGFIARKAAP